MGVPTHYSQDLPVRCLKLITELWTTVQTISVDGQERLGSLTTTFLLAMASPIIVLPIERIERQRGKEVGGYVNDRPLNENLVQEVDKSIGGGRFDACSFFEPGQWRFATCEFEHQNFALEFPDDLREMLDSEGALSAAASMQASQWASVLRNAISHGGVSYLDRYGRAEHGNEATMLAFVSAKYPKFPKGHAFEGRSDTEQPPISLNVLRITEEGFQSFLRGWVEWLDASGMSKVTTDTEQSDRAGSK